MIVLIWACFFSLWIIYPIYFFFLRNKIVHFFYRLLLLLLPILGFGLFIGKLSVNSPKFTSLCISALNFLLLSFHFFRTPLKITFPSTLDLLIILSHLFLMTLLFTDIIGFRLFDLSDDQTGGLLGAFAVMVMLIWVRIKKVS